MQRRMLASVEVINSWDLDAELIVRLLGAAVLGGIIGVEREASEQQAGLRTHIAVALGAALFGAVSTLGFQEFDQPRARTVLQADVTRVASNVAVGIGFLGAGVIFRQGHSIKNLTTAASLWVVAAIGLAAGVGNMSIATIGTIVLLVSLVLLRPVRTAIRRRTVDEESSYVRIVVNEPQGVGDVIAALDRAQHVELRHLDVETADDETVVVAHLKGGQDASRRAISDVARLGVVQRVTEEDTSS
jgi:putative Mg2+ transporter-C (MgtC) family protein